MVSGSNYIFLVLYVDDIALATSDLSCYIRHPIYYEVIKEALWVCFKGVDYVLKPLQDFL